MRYGTEGPTRVEGDRMCTVGQAARSGSTTSNIGNRWKTVSRVTIRDPVLDHRRRGLGLDHLGPLEIGNDLRRSATMSRAGLGPEDLDPGGEHGLHAASSSVHGDR